MNKSLIFLTITLVGALTLMSACSKHETVPGTTMTPAQASAIQAASARKAAQAGTIGAAMPTATATIIKPGETATASLPHLAYIALLYPLNSTTIGTSTVGKAQLAIDGDKLTIRINVANAPPGIVHWQHIHGFVDGKNAKCPTSTADTNGDGIVDLIETGSASGTTMIPLNANPVAMDIPAAGYPQASAEGAYMYQKTVSLKALQAAFGKQFKGQKLDLANRVIYVHGVPPTTKLPASVSTLPGAPAYITLPIACGTITAVPQSAAPTPQS